ncbi:MAG: hypothetical protein AB7I37_00035 [Pirellulales bacterium]
MLTMPTLTNDFDLARLANRLPNQFGSDRRANYVRFKGSDQDGHLVGDGELLSAKHDLVPINHGRQFPTRQTAAPALQNARLGLAGWQQSGQQSKLYEAFKRVRIQGTA